VEVQALGPSVAFTVTEKRVFVSWGGAAGKAPPGTGIVTRVGANGKPFAIGISAMAGLIIPKQGRTASDVVVGQSTGFAGGYIAGAERWSNNAGVALGVGVTTPGFSVGTSFGSPLGSGARSGERKKHDEAPQH